MDREEILDDGGKLIGWVWRDDADPKLWCYQVAKSNGQPKGTPGGGTVGRYGAVALLKKAHQGPAG